MRRTFEQITRYSSFILLLSSVSLVGCFSSPSRDTEKAEIPPARALKRSSHEPLASELVVGAITSARARIDRARDVAEARWASPCEQLARACALLKGGCAFDKKTSRCVAPGAWCDASTGDSRVKKRSPEHATAILERRLGMLAALPDGVLEGSLAERVGELSRTCPRDGFVFYETAAIEGHDGVLASFRDLLGEELWIGTYLLTPGPEGEGLGVQFVHGFLDSDTGAGAASWRFEAPRFTRERGDLGALVYAVSRSTSHYYTDPKLGSACCTSNLHTREFTLFLRGEQLALHGVTRVADREGGVDGEAFTESTSCRVEVEVVDEDTIRFVRHSREPSKPRSRPRITRQVIDLTEGYAEAPLCPLHR